MPRKITKILSFILCFLLIFEQSGFAQVAGPGQLDIALHLNALRENLIPEKFRPLHLRYLSYNATTNNFNLLLDKGDFNVSLPAPKDSHVSLRGPKGRSNLKEIASSPTAPRNDIENETKILLNYFFIGVSLPNSSFWVNLRPDSADKIIDDDLAQTDIGKILLEADLQLKKDTANFTSPKTLEGKEYWDKLYRRSGELFGNDNVTIPTLTRPWIVPGEIIIRESEQNAYVYKATLKVMLEQDYLRDSPLRGQSQYNFDDPRLKELNEYSSELIRELIIPKLTKEVNNAKRYAALRQVYYSIVLAQWFKKKYYGKSGTYPSIIDSRNLNGLISQEPCDVRSYFAAYKKSFQDGEYKISEPVYTPFGQSLRSYFSGGIVLDPAQAPAGTNFTVNPSEAPLAKPLFGSPNSIEGTGTGGNNQDLSCQGTKVGETRDEPLKTGEASPVAAPDASVNQPNAAPEAKSTSLRQNPDRGRAGLIINFGAVAEWAREKTATMRIKFSNPFFWYRLFLLPEFILANSGLSLARSLGLEKLSVIFAWWLHSINSPNQIGQNREIATLESTINSIKGSKEIRIVYYPGIGFDVKKALLSTDAALIVGVDPLPDARYIENTYVAEILALGGRNLKVIHEGKLGKGGKVTFQFGYKGRDRQIILYRQDATRYTPDVIVETSNGYDMFLQYGVPVMPRVFIEQSVRLLNGKGLFLPFADTVDDGELIDDLQLPIVRIKTGPLIPGTGSLWVKVSDADSNRTADAAARPSPPSIGEGPAAGAGASAAALDDVWSAEKARQYGISLRPRAEQEAWIDLYETMVLPLLHEAGLDGGHPFTFELVLGSLATTHGSDIQLLAWLVEQFIAGKINRGEMAAIIAHEIGHIKNGAAIEAEVDVETANETRDYIEAAELIIKAELGTAQDVVSILTRAAVLKAEATAAGAMRLSPELSQRTSQTHPYAAIIKAVKARFNMQTAESAARPGPRVSAAPEAKDDSRGRVYAKGIVTLVGLGLGVVLGGATGLLVLLAAFVLDMWGGKILNAIKTLGHAIFVEYPRQRRIARISSLIKFKEPVLPRSGATLAQETRATIRKVLEQDYIGQLERTGIARKQAEKFLLYDLPAIYNWHSEDAVEAAMKLLRRKIRFEEVQKLFLKTLPAKWEGDAYIAAYRAGEVADSDLLERLDRKWPHRQGDNRWRLLVAGPEAYGGVAYAMAAALVKFAEADFIEKLQAKGMARGEAEHLLFHDLMYESKLGINQTDIIALQMLDSNLIERLAVEGVKPATAARFLLGKLIMSFPLESQQIAQALTEAIEAGLLQRLLWQETQLGAAKILEDCLPKNLAFANPSIVANIALGWILEIITDRIEACGVDRHEAEILIKALAAPFKSIQDTKIIAVYAHGDFAFNAICETLRLVEAGVPFQVVKRLVLQESTITLSSLRSVFSAGLMEKLLAKGFPRGRLTKLFYEDLFVDRPSENYTDALYYQPDGVARALIKVADSTLVAELVELGVPLDEAQELVWFIIPAEYGSSVGDLTQAVVKLLKHFQQKGIEINARTDLMMLYAIAFNTHVYYSDQKNAKDLLDFIAAGYVEQLGGKDVVLPMLVTLSTSPARLYQLGLVFSALTKLLSTPVMQRLLHNPAKAAALIEGILQAEDTDRELIFNALSEGIFSLSVSIDELGGEDNFVAFIAKITRLTKANAAMAFRVMGVLRKQGFSYVDIQKACKGFEGLGQDADQVGSTLHTIWLAAERGIFASVGIKSILRLAEIFDQDLLSFYRALDILREHGMLGSLRDLPEDLEAVAEEVYGNFNPANPLHLLFNYAEVINQGGRYGISNRLSFAEYFKRINEREAEGKASGIDKVMERELRGLTYEADLVRDEILKLKKRADELGRPLLVVENLSYGAVALAPVTEERNGQKYIVGTDIPVVSSKVGSTESHNNENVLNPSLFDAETQAMILKDNPLVVVVDGSTSVSDKNRTSPHIPDGFKGYRNYFLAVNEAIFGGMAEENFYEDQEFAQVLAATTGYQALVAGLKSRGARPSSATGYALRFWYPGEKDLYLRVKKQRDTVAPNLGGDIASINGPAVIFIQSAMEPEARQNDPAKDKFIAGRHTPAFFDDKDHFKQFYLAYEEGHGLQVSQQYISYARMLYTQLCAMRGKPVPKQNGVPKVKESVVRIDVVASDLDGVLAITDQDLEGGMINQLVRVLKKGRTIVMMTEDLKANVDRRVIQYIPIELRRRVLIFSDGGSLGYGFRQDGSEFTLDTYNKKSNFSPELRLHIEQVLNDNLAGRFKYDERPNRISLENRIDLRDVSERDKFIAQLNYLLSNDPLLKAQGVTLKVYKTGSTSVKIVRQHKEQALRYCMDTFDFQEENILIMGDSARTNQVDRGLLTAFPKAVSVNVGRQAQTIFGQNPNILQFGEQGIKGTLVLLAHVNMRGGVPKRFIASLQKQINPRRPRRGIGEEEYAGELVASKEILSHLHGLYVCSSDGRTIYVNRSELEACLKDPAQHREFARLLGKEDFTIEEALRFIDGHETFHALIDELRLRGIAVEMTEAEEEALADLFGRDFALGSASLDIRLQKPLAQLSRILKVDVAKIIRKRQTLEETLEEFGISVQVDTTKTNEELQVIKQQAEKQEDAIVRPMQKPSAAPAGAAAPAAAPPNAPAQSAARPLAEIRDILGQVDEDNGLFSAGTINIHQRLTQYLYRCLVSKSPFLRSSSAEEQEAHAAAMQEAMRQACDAIFGRETTRYPIASADGFTGLNLLKTDPVPGDVRIYINLKEAQSALALIASLPRQLHNAEIGFLLKFSQDPADYGDSGRFDNTVVYVKAADAAKAAEIIIQCQRQNPGWFGAETPLFCKKICPGVALAQDMVRKGKSHFNHLAEIVFNAVCIERGNIRDDLSAEFASEEYNPDKPYLISSVDIFAGIGNEPQPEDIVQAGLSQLESRLDVGYVRRIAKESVQAVPAAAPKGLEGGTETLAVVQRWAEQGDITRLTAHLVQGQGAKSIQPGDDTLEFILQYLPPERQAEFFRALEARGTKVAQELQEGRVLPAAGAGVPAAAARKFSLGSWGRGKINAAQLYFIRRRMKQARISERTINGLLASVAGIPDYRLRTTKMSQLGQRTTIDALRRFDLSLYESCANEEQRTLLISELAQSSSIVESMLFLRQAMFAFATPESVQEGRPRLGIEKEDFAKMLLNYFTLLRSARGALFFISSRAAAEFLEVYSKDNEAMRKMIQVLLPKLVDDVISQGIQDPPLFLYNLMRAVSWGDETVLREVNRIIPAIKQVCINATNSQQQQSALGLLSIATREGMRPAFDALMSLLPDMPADAIPIDLRSQRESGALLAREACLYLFREKPDAQIRTRILKELHGQITEETPVLSIWVATVETLLPEFESIVTDMIHRDPELVRAALAAARSAYEVGGSVQAQASLVRLLPVIKDQLIIHYNQRLRDEAVFCLAVLAGGADDAARQGVAEFIQNRINRATGDEAFRFESMGQTPRAMAESLNRLLKATGMRLGFFMREVSSINALRGLLEVLPIAPENIVVYYTFKKPESMGQAVSVVNEVTIDLLIQRLPPGCHFELLDEEGLPSPRVITFSFHDVRGFGWHSGRSAPVCPFKFGIPELADEAVSLDLRNELASNSRRIVVLGSVEVKDFQHVATWYWQAYQSLPRSQRPLLVVAPRKSSEVDMYKRMLPAGMQSAMRTPKDREDRLPFANMDNQDVLFVATQGELLSLYAAADIAVVGADRNILEPSSQRKPVLYMSGKWINNQQAFQALTAVGGALEFSEANFLLLLNDQARARRVGEAGFQVASDFKQNQIPSAAQAFALLSAILVAVNARSAGVEQMRMVHKTRDGEKPVARDGMSVSIADAESEQATLADVTSDVLGILTLMAAKLSITIDSTQMPRVLLAPAGLGTSACDSLHRIIYVDPAHFGKGYVYAEECMHYLRGLSVPEDGSLTLSEQGAVNEFFGRLGETWLAEWVKGTPYERLFVDYQPRQWVSRVQSEAFKKDLEQSRQGYERAGQLIQDSAKYLALIDMLISHVRLLSDRWRSGEVDDAMYAASLATEQQAYLQQAEILLAQRILPVPDLVKRIPSFFDNLLEVREAISWVKVVARYLRESNNPPERKHFLEKYAEVKERAHVAIVSLNEILATARKEMDGLVRIFEYVQVTNKWSSFWHYAGYVGAELFVATNVSGAISSDALVRLPTREVMERYVDIRAAFNDAVVVDVAPREGTAASPILQARPSSAIGKYVELEPISVGVDGRLRGKVQHIETKKVINLADLKQEPLSEEALESRLQNVDKLINALPSSAQRAFLRRVMREFQKNIPPHAILMESGATGYFGAGKPELLLLDKDLAQRPLVLLHEILEHLQSKDNKLIPQLKHLLDEIHEEWLGGHKYRYDSEGRGDYFERNRAHFVIRAFTRQVFGSEDKALTQEIKQRQGIGNSFFNIENMMETFILKKSSGITLLEARLARLRAAPDVPPDEIAKREFALRHERRELESQKFYMEQLRKEMKASTVAEFIRALRVTGELREKLAPWQRDALRWAAKDLHRSPAEFDYIFFVPEDSWLRAFFDFRSAGQIINITDGDNEAHIVLIDDKYWKTEEIAKIIFHEEEHKKFRRGVHTLLRLHREDSGLISILEEAVVEKTARATMKAAYEKHVHPIAAILNGPGQADTIFPTYNNEIAFLDALAGKDPKALPSIISALQSGNHALLIDSLGAQRDLIRSIIREHCPWVNQGAELKLILMLITAALSRSNTREILETGRFVFELIAGVDLYGFDDESRREVSLVLVESRWQIARSLLAKLFQARIFLGSVSKEAIAQEMRVVVQQALQKKGIAVDQLQVSFWSPEGNELYDIYSPRGAQGMPYPEEGAAEGRPSDEFIDGYPEPLGDIQIGNLKNIIDGGEEFTAAEKAELLGYAADSSQAVFLSNAPFPGIDKICATYTVNKGGKLEKFLQKKGIAGSCNIDVGDRIIILLGEGEVGLHHEFSEIDYRHRLAKSFPNPNSNAAFINRAAHILAWSKQILEARDRDLEKSEDAAIQFIHTQIDRMSIEQLSRFIAEYESGSRTSVSSIHQIARSQFFTPRESDDINVFEKEVCDYANQLRKDKQEGKRLYPKMAKEQIRSRIREVYREMRYCRISLTALDEGILEVTNTTSVKKVLGTLGFYIYHGNLLYIAHEDSQTGLRKFHLFSNVMNNPVDDDKLPPEVATYFGVPINDNWQEEESGPGYTEEGPTWPTDDSSTGSTSTIPTHIKRAFTLLGLNPEIATKSEVNKNFVRKFHEAAPGNSDRINYTAAESAKIKELIEARDACLKYLREHSSQARSRGVTLGGVADEYEEEAEGLMWKFSMSQNESGLERNENPPAAGAVPAETPGPTQCVTADTLLPVVKEDNGGKTKSTIQLIAITAVKPGDYVLSLNESTQEIEPRRIKGLLDMGVKPVYKLTTASGRTIKTTANHPYLVKLNNSTNSSNSINSKWVKVSELKEGMEIAAAEGLFRPGSNTALINNKKLSLKLGVVKDYSVRGASQMRFGSGNYFNPFISKGGNDILIDAFVGKNSHNSLSRQSSLHGMFHKLGCEFHGSHHVFFGNIGVLFGDIFQGVAGSDQVKNIAYSDACPLDTRFTKSDASIDFNSVSIHNLHPPFIAENNITVGASQDDLQIAYEPIISIEPLPPERVYDIEVEGTHNFIGNGIFAHNTAIFPAAGAVAPAAGAVALEPEMPADLATPFFPGDGIIGSMAEGKGELHELMKGRIQKIKKWLVRRFTRDNKAEQYAWGFIIWQLERRRQKDDDTLILQALEKLRVAGIDDSEADEMLKKIIPVAVKESRLRAEADYLGGLLVKHGGELKVLFPRHRLQELQKEPAGEQERVFQQEILGDLFHELVEIGLLKHGHDVPEAHRLALIARNIFIHQGDEAARGYIAELRNPYRQARLEEGFKDIVEHLLESRNIDEQQPLSFNQDQLRSLLGDFWEIIQSRAPPVMEGLIYALLTPQKIAEYRQEFGHFDRADVILLLQRIHTYAVNIAELGMNEEMLKQHPLVILASLSVVTPAVHFELLKQAELAGPSWDILGDTDVRAWLAAGELDKVLARLKDNPDNACLVAICERFKINNQHMQHNFIAQYLMNDMFLPERYSPQRKQVIAQSCRSDFIHRLSMIVRLQMLFNQRSAGIFIQGFVGRGRDGIVLLASYHGKEAVVKVNIPELDLPNNVTSREILQVAGVTAGDRHFVRNLFTEDMRLTKGPEVYAVEVNELVEGVSLKRISSHVDLFGGFDNNLSMLVQFLQIQGYLADNDLVDADIYNLSNKVADHEGTLKLVDLGNIIPFSRMIEEIADGLPENRDRQDIRQGMSMYQKKEAIAVALRILTGFEMGVSTTSEPWFIVSAPARKTLVGFCNNRFGAEYADLAGKIIDLCAEAWVDDRISVSSLARLLRAIIFAEGIDLRQARLDGLVGAMHEAQGALPPAAAPVVTEMQETEPINAYIRKIETMGGQPTKERIEKNISAQPEYLLDEIPEQKDLLKSMQPLQFSLGVLYHGNPDVDGAIRNGRILKGAGIWGEADTARIVFTRAGQQYPLELRREEKSSPGIFVIKTEAFNSYLKTGKANMGLPILDRKSGEADHLSPFLEAPLPISDIWEIWVSETTLKRYQDIAEGRIASEVEFRENLRVLLNEGKIVGVPGLQDANLYGGKLMDKINIISHYLIERGLLLHIPHFTKILTTTGSLSKVQPAATHLTTSVLVPDSLTQGASAAGLSAGNPAESADAPVSSTAPNAGDAPADAGGINLTNLPIVTQQVKDLGIGSGTVPFKDSPLAIASPSLEKEWLEIQRMLQAKIIPSSQRIKEYLALCASQKDCAQEVGKVIACIADILRIEEENCSATDNALKELLVLSESKKESQELQLALAQVAVEEKEPR